MQKAKIRLESSIKEALFYYVKSKLVNELCLQMISIILGTNINYKHQHWQFFLNKVSSPMCTYLQKECVNNICKSTVQYFPNKMHLQNILGLVISKYILIYNLLFRKLNIMLDEMALQNLIQVCIIKKPKIDFFSKYI